MLGELSLIDEDFCSYRDILKNWVSLYRLIKFEQNASDHELNFLGFITHFLNNSNFCNHQSSIEQQDLLFAIYYSVKAAHKLKAIFYYLAFIRQALNEFIAYAKSAEILDVSDYQAWEPIPDSF